MCRVFRENEPALTPIYARFSSWTGGGRGPPSLRLRNRRHVSRRRVDGRPVVAQHRPKYTSAGVGEMQSTTFDPVVHGWHFNNTDIEWEVLNEGGRHGKNLCGGMVYLALDYFNGNRAIPPDTTPPDMRSVLGKKIYDRQKDAHKHTL